MVFNGGYFKSHGITGGHFSMATIDVYEGLYIMVLDVTNAFIHNKITTMKGGEERVIMKITGVIVNILL